MKEKYEAEEITAAKYKKYLTGHKRVKFALETRVREQIQKELAMEGNAEINEKLRHLKSLNTSSNATSPTAIAELESMWKEIESTKAAIDEHKNTLLSQAERFVNLWIDDGFLETKTNYLEFTWPTSVSEASFYLFGALLMPKSKWNEQIHSDSNISQMQKEQQEHVNGER